MHAWSKTFREEGYFAAMYAAEAWLEANGYSVGPGDAVSKKRGILKGDYHIAKYRNLTAKERAELHGEMIGDMRAGPVTVLLKEAPEGEQK